MGIREHGPRGGGVSLGRAVGLVGRRIVREVLRLLSRGLAVGADDGALQALQFPGVPALCTQRIFGPPGSGRLLRALCIEERT